MDLEQFTEKSRKVLQDAQGLALRSNHQRFTTEHLLATLIEEPSIATLLGSTGADVSAIAANVKAALNKLPKVEGSGAQMYLGAETARVLEHAKDLAKK